MEQSRQSRNPSSDDSSMHKRPRKCSSSIPSTVPEKDCGDVARDPRLTLLGLPAEVRVRILRELLVHDGPITAIIPPKENQEFDDDDMVVVLDKSIETLDDLELETQSEVKELLQAYPMFSVCDVHAVRKLFHDASRAMKYLSLLSTQGEISLKLYNNRSKPRILLSRSILLVNRQLYEEGSEIFYSENSIPFRVRTHRIRTPSRRPRNVWNHKVTISCFDRRRTQEILRLDPGSGLGSRRKDLIQYQDLHPTLLKFTKLHFNIELEYGAVTDHAMSYLRYLVGWLNEQHEPRRPRHITVLYKHTIEPDFNRVRRLAFPERSTFFCEPCKVDEIDHCRCSSVVDDRNRTSADALKVLGPLKHLRKVKYADVFGIPPEYVETLSSAMSIGDQDKPIDLCGPLVRLVKYLNVLPADADTQAAAKEVDYTELENHIGEEVKDPPVGAFAGMKVDYTTFHLEEITTAISLEKCPSWIYRDATAVMDTMHANDVQAFVGLRRIILQRVDMVMATMRRRQLGEGL